VTDVAQRRTFILSPARCDGKRARMLLSPRASFPLAVQLRREEGAPIGEVFSFLSGLYFRGKLTYAQAFAARGQAAPSILVVTTDRGLVGPDTVVRVGDLERFASVDIGSADERFRAPMRRDIEALVRGLASTGLAVLLGSIATGKYVDLLIEQLGERVVFPVDFVGRGDMSRGGLLLRQARSGVELPYVPVVGAMRHGKRPPKLERLR
jgi:hypothetical protein